MALEKTRKKKGTEQQILGHAFGKHRSKKLWSCATEKNTTLTRKK